ncbi:MAG: hypothetical protein JW894_09530 [Bacteroidales bacterium]|nr:hypothetical protein [Bacteroidales bacterium]
MDKIKFGTDGWRGIIAKDFTLSNVAMVAYALARWLTGKFKDPCAVIGYDTRFGGEMFTEAVAKILASKNIRVYISESYVSTPMVSLGVVKLKAKCGVMITASHNPAEFNGIKLKGEHGGPMFINDLRDIENLITTDYEFDLEMLNWNYLVEQGLIQYINLESIYLKNIHDHFDIDQINNSGLRLAFDAMYGSSQNIFKKLLPDVVLFHCDVNPTFHGIPPEPLPKNLHEIEEYIFQKKNIDCTLAVDGDGDRLVLFDEKGNYLDSHQVFLLVIYYLAHYENINGVVVAGVSSTGKIETLCSKYNLKVTRTPIGFKEISRIMITENVLAGGEESGGITIGNYIPERDGIWVGLSIWQWLAKSGKKLSELLQEVREITGEFAYERIDLEINKNLRNKILEHCKNNVFDHFGTFQVKNIQTIDGYKFFFDNERWVLIRASGTEPLLRIYIEAENQSVVTDIASSVIGTLKL